ncbi:MAG: hypothetical protein QNJ54_09600 [Prochloraceae cyanobacterium]|nr:hypothetical protein [Prochloraceae cyanobacterium]
MAFALRLRLPELEKLWPVQATFFYKSFDRNWFVWQHRDTVIPVAKHHSLPGWKNPTYKEGVPFIEPPWAIAAECLALRLHFDNCPDGHLELVPGSHKKSFDSEDIPAETLSLQKSDALIMNPWLIHSSGKITNPGSMRRVIHILYGPKQLPSPFNWFQFVA